MILCFDAGPRLNYLEGVIFHGAFVRIECFDGSGHVPSVEFTFRTNGCLVSCGVFCVDLFCLLECCACFIACLIACVLVCLLAYLGCAVPFSCARSSGAWFASWLLALGTGASAIRMLQVVQVVQEGNTFF